MSLDPNAPKDTGRSSSANSTTPTAHPPKEPRVHRGDDPDPTAKLNMSPEAAVRALKGDDETRLPMGWKIVLGVTAVLALILVLTKILMGWESIIAGTVTLTGILVLAKILG